jgi:hypothetical protein
MIQIQRREQFTKAAERLTREPQSIRRHEPGLYAVTNKIKGHQYHVRIERKDGHTFGSCTCPRRDLSESCAGVAQFRSSAAAV